jgi:hypothetical protein
MGRFVPSMAIGMRHASDWLHAFEGVVSLDQKNSPLFASPAVMLRVTRV